MIGKIILAGLFAVHSVIAKAPSVVFTMKPGAAYFVDQAGMIETCEAPYALYVQPLGPKVAIAFYQVVAPNMIRETETSHFIATCLLVK